MSSENQEGPPTPSPIYDTPDGRAQGDLTSTGASRRATGVADITGAKTRKTPAASAVETTGRSHVDRAANLLQQGASDLSCHSESIQNKLACSEKASHQRSTAPAEPAVAAESRSNDSATTCSVKMNSGRISGSSSESVDSGKLLSYGIPSGADSMKALRRHVELLIDRELNTKTRSRLETCLDALDPERLDPHLMRVVCAKGLPDGCAALRSVYWRILLHCLPLQPSEWQERRRKLREAYESYKADFIREPEAVRRLRQLQQHQQGEGAACTIGDRCTLLTTSPSAESSLASNREDFNFGTPHSGSSQLSPSISLAVVKDHPLCRSATSEWRGYWVDAEVFDQINKDVFRTRPELCFFAMNPEQTVTRQQQLHLYPPPPTRQAQSHMQRIDEVPLLVDYDLLVQQQHRQHGQQQKDSGAPVDEAMPCKTKASTRKFSSISSASGTFSNSNSSSSNELDSPLKVSSSSLRGFRLPSAFRYKKAVTPGATTVSILSDDGCSSRSEVKGESIRNSADGRSCSSRSSSGGGETPGSGERQCFAERVDKEKVGDSSPIEAFLSRGSADMQSCSVSVHSRESLDAADALEASAVAARAARMLKRQMITTKRGTEKSACSSNIDRSFCSSNSLLSNSALSQRQVASVSPPFPPLNEVKEGHVQDSCPARVDASSSATVAVVKEHQKVGTVSVSLNDDCAGGFLSSTLERGAAPTDLAAEEGKNTTQQPWRAPAGVQDVCNMVAPRRHYDVLSRLLFIYAKVNPGLCYVQGMNEILAPIYYALMTDPTYTDYEQAEAEVFYCFSEVMQQQRDAFCKALDPTEAGVQGRLSRLDTLLRQKDEEVWMHLNAVGVEPQFYALRWLLLMLTQEFEMPDVLALWDGFIADTGRPLPLLYYVCVAIIIWLRPALLAGDFTACMKLLQHLPSFDPKALISSAMRLRADDLLKTGLQDCRVSLPVGRGGRRAGDALHELDPVQHISDSLIFKQFSRAIAALSLSDSLGLVPGDAARPASSGEGEISSPCRPQTQKSEGDSSRGFVEGPDAALGRLKRLAGVGVEHAYRGASVVSQYLTSSGLSTGLASNVTSLFASDSNACSPATPPEPSEAPTAERPRQSAASKLGEFFAAAAGPSPPGILSGVPADRSQHCRATAAPVVEEQKGNPPPLIECPNSFARPFVGSRAQSFTVTGCDVAVGESPRQRSLWEDEPSTPLGERLTDSDKLETPRHSPGTESFKSPSGDGLQITIL